MGKVAMSVPTKGLATDFEREGKTEMAVTSIWPVVVRLVIHSLQVPVNEKQSIQSGATRNPFLKGPPEKTYNILMQFWLCSGRPPAW